MRSKSPAALRAQVEKWNAANPVGTRVMVTKDDRSRVKTLTRSEARVLGDHSAVISVDGISGVYILDRIVAFKTARCDKLRADPLNSNDLRAWQKLAEQLEDDLTEERRARLEDNRETQRDYRDIAAQARSEGIAEARGEGRY